MPPELPRGRAQRARGERWQGGLVATGAGLLLLVLAAVALRAGEPLPMLVGGVLALWGLGGVAFGLAELLELRD